MARLYGIFLIAVLVLVSGLIAYVGDIVGRRMGRRRLTLFGLRPRHTAVVISVVSGMVITIITLAVVMTLSKDVRDAFTRVVDLRQEGQRLTRANAALTRDLHQASSALRDAHAQLDPVKDQLAAANSNLRKVHLSLGVARSELKRRRQELAQVRVQLAQAQQDVKRAQSRLQEVMADLNRKSADLTQANKEIANAERLFGELEARRRGLESDIRDLVVWSAQEFGRIRTGTVVFEARQTMDAVVLSGDEPRADVRERLNRFVTELADLAAGQGAKPVEQGRAVVILNLFRDEESGQIVRYGEQETLDALADQIVENKGSVVVRAFAARNALQGEPVFIDFQLHPNRKIYDVGEELARTIVSGGDSQWELLPTLIGFLKKDVGERARERGMMPLPTTRVTPGGVQLFETAEFSVSQVTFPELGAVVEEIKQHRGRVRVIATAAQDTWTVGPLRVKFAVAPVE